MSKETKVVSQTNSDLAVDPYRSADSDGLVKYSTDVLENEIAIRKKVHLKEQYKKELIELLTKNKNIYAVESFWGIFSRRYVKFFVIKHNLFNITEQLSIVLNLKLYKYDRIKFSDFKNLKGTWSYSISSKLDNIEISLQFLN